MALMRCNVEDLGGTAVSTLSNTFSILTTVHCLPVPVCETLHSCVDSSDRDFSGQKSQIHKVCMCVCQLVCSDVHLYTICVIVIATVLVQICFPFLI